MVSTPIVLEAVRKSVLPEMTLERLIGDLKTLNPYMGRLISYDTKKKKEQLEESKTIITTCISGLGAAKSIEKLLKNALLLDENVSIKSLGMDSIKNISEVIGECNSDNIVAVVGTVDLQLRGIPFISVDELVMGEGMERIGNILKMHDCRIEMEKPNRKDILIDILRKILAFLDPQKAYFLISDSFESIKKVLALENTSRLCARYVLHCSCMIERLIRNEPLPYANVDHMISSNIEAYLIVKNAFKAIEDSIEISIPDTELAYILELIFSDNV